MKLLIILATAFGIQIVTGFFMDLIIDGLILGALFAMKQFPDIFKKT